MLGRNDEQVSAFHPTHVGRPIRNRHAIGKIPDELKAEQRHVDVLGQVNCTRHPPEARNVDANSYVGSGSTTQTLAPGMMHFAK
jgi:hypothetical protein